MTPDEVRFMKTVQIPINSNPFIVSINNHVYQYRAGETIEVPDEVAAAIEDALKLEPKPKRYLSRLAQRADSSIAELTHSDLDGVENISYFAFGQCVSLISVEIPDCVKTLSGSAFHGCNRLQYVRFGANSRLESIGTEAFRWCSQMKKVYLPVIPPVLADVNAFANVNATCVFCFKTQASLDAYKAADKWSTLAGTFTFVVEA